MRATVGAVYDVYDRALEFGHLPNDWRGQNSPPWPRRGLRFPVTILTFRLGHDIATKCEIQDANMFLLTPHLVEMAKLQGAVL
jgi:hypothetical protein